MVASRPVLRCLWLTALTAATLTISGCTGNGVLAGHPAPTPVTTKRAASVGVGRTQSVPPLPQTSPLAPVSASPTALPAVALPQNHGVLVVSDGTSTVRVGGRRVRFPSAVTDATVSPNGTVVAYVDGDGSIATAHLDGTGVRVLTDADPGVRRAHPTFEDGGSEIVFTERGHDGVWRLKEVAADGHDRLTGDKTDPTLLETRRDHGGDTAPSATWFQASHSHVARSVMVFQHVTSRGVRKIYIADRNQRGAGVSPLLPGRAPAISPAGDRVAYIAPSGQIDLLHLPVLSRKPHPVQITWDAHPVGHLGWSPDGRTLVFSTRHGIDSVAAQPAQRGHNPVTMLSPHPGAATYGTAAAPTVGVYSGSDPASTAVRVSRAHFVSGRKVPRYEGGSFSIAWTDRVTLVSADDPAAAGVAAAVAHGGPVLFIRGGHLGRGVRREIVRLLATPPGGEFPQGTVDIVADTGAIPTGIDAAVRSLGFKVMRFDPAAASSDSASADPREQAYIVVSRTDLPAVVASSGTPTPVLLTDEQTMPASTARVLNTVSHYPGYPATVYAVGVQAQTAVRSTWPGKPKFRIVDIGGSDPYGNTLDATEGLYDSPGRIAVAPAASWTDELIASMVGPTLVVDEAHGLEPAASAWLSASEPALRGVYVVGGSRALPGTIGRSVYGHRYRLAGSPRDVVASSDVPE